MEYKDYYKTRGVNKKATQEEIKKAYKKLAFRYHPDQNPDNKQAEDKFKEINEANEVLSNPENRQKYDMLGANWKHYQQGDFSRGQGGPTVEFEGDLRDLFSGGGAGSFFEAFFGGGRRQGGGRPPTARQGRDFEANAEISLEEAYTGVKLSLAREGTRINFQVKPGVEDGQKLRIPGKGGDGPMGWPSGDLYVKGHIRRHPRFKRKGNALHTELTVDLYTVLLGGKAVIQTLKGPKHVSVPAGTQHGKVLKLKGLGMPDLKQSGHFGDLYAKIDIQLPEKLSPEEIALFRQLAAMRK